MSTIPVFRNDKLFRVSFQVITFVVILTVGLLSSQAAEGNEIVTDRPDQTESSSSVKPGVVQLEVGWGYTFDKSATGFVRTNEFPQTLVRIGAVDGFEIRLIWNGQIWENPSRSKDDSFNGIGDVAVGGKLELWPEKGSRPEAALLFGFSLPVGDNQFTSGKINPSARMSFANKLTDILSLGYNFGFTSVSMETLPGQSQTDYYGQYTIVLGASLSDKIGAFVELYGDIRIDDSDLPQHSADGGLTFSVKENIQFDLAGGFGISSSSSDWILMSGISIRFPE